MKKPYYSPRIDLSAVTSATLTFWHRFAFAGGDRGFVRLHYGDGEWTDVRRFTGTNPTWQQVSLDLSPFVGGALRISFTFGPNRQIHEAADGWYIDDVAVYSSDFETSEPPPPPPAPQAALEGPAPNSFQSGIGLIYGWACEAEEIVIELAGTPVPAAYGTPRADTQGVCGDSDNGFGLPMNWNLLGNGEHTIRALADGMEFARTTVRVTTLGVEVLKGAQRTVVVPDFPHPGDTTTLQWEESLQNFVIVPK